MSLEFTLYLRKRPLLRNDSVGGIKLEISPYTSAAYDPIHDQPWSHEIKWKVLCYGRLGDDDYNEWEWFTRRMCKRYDGVLWDAQAQSFSELQLDELPEEDDDDEDEVAARDAAQDQADKAAAEDWAIFENWSKQSGLPADIAMLLYTSRDTAIAAYATRFGMTYKEARQVLAAHPIPKRPKRPRPIPTRPKKPRPIPTRPKKPRPIPTRPKKPRPIPTRPKKPRPKRPRARKARVV